MLRILVNTGRLLAALVIYVAVYLCVGAAISIVVILIYVNSADYCRDCDTGLGLCCIGFFLALPVSGAIIYFINPFINRILRLNTILELIDEP